MPQVSKNPIHKDVYYQIRDDFIWIISALKSTDEIKAFYYDFFTKTERIMLSKRLAVALMLHKGFKYDEIQFILHVSTATISRVADWLDDSGAGVKHAMDKIVTGERMEEFWRRLEKFIDKNLLHPYKKRYMP